MSLPPSLAVRRLLWCAPFVIAGACSVDQGRGLSYGVSNGSANSLTEAAGEGSGGNGSGSGPGDAGESAAPGGAPNGSSAGVASGGNSPASGGEPSHEAGAPSVAGSAVVVGGNNAGGVANGGQTSQGGSVTNGGSSGSTSAGSGGTVDDSPCGDVDQNGVQDCQETLAKNAAFDTNVDGWIADPGVTKVWQADDARGKASGSVRLTFATSNGGSGWVLAAVGQCVPAWSEQEFEVGARSFIPTGQGGGRSEVSLAVFSEDDCHGGFLDSLVPVLSAETGSWQSLHGNVKMPAGTRSVLVRLAASKPGSQASLEVHFDDILFRKK